MLADANVSTVSSEIPGWLQTIQDPFVYGGLLIASIVVAIVLGNALSKNSRMEDSWWRFALVIGTVLISLLVIGTKWPPKYGVDLKGGTIIIGQIDKDSLAQANSNGESGSSLKLEELIRQLKIRIDPTGLKEIVIKSQGSDKIEVIIPDVDTPEAERIWRKMTTIGFLQFRMVATNLLEGARAKELAAEQAGVEDINIRRSRIVYDSSQAEGEPSIIARWYDIGRVAALGAENAEGKSLAYKEVPVATALVRNAATGEIVPPALYQNVGNGEVMKLLAEAQGINQLQVLLLEPTENFRVDGEHVQNNRRGQKGFEPIVEFTMTLDGARRLARLTEYFKAQGQAKNYMGVVLDGNVMSAPAINSPIQKQGIIEGNFTNEEVDDLVTILNAGRIKVALKKDYISMDSIQSSLGEELKQKGIYAIAAALLVVLIFMAVYYYEYAGLIACFVLVLNMLMVAALMMLVGQALTLTGLAGFVLTVGMSVDANVLIFERIREEIDKGTAVRMAIRNGFDRAMSTIIDANVTTLITAVVLYVIGQEQIKSFAVVLILGILTSMFTAIFVARLIFDWLERKKVIKSLKMMKIMSSQRINVMGRSKIAAVFSIGLILIGLVAMFARGGGIFDYDLRGGSTARTVFNQSMQQLEIAKQLNDLKIIDSQGEPVLFSVSPLTSTDYTDGTYFKIESTLAIPAEDKKTADFRDLKTILKDKFGDQLRRLEVETSEVTVAPIGVQTETAAPATDGTATPAIDGAVTPAIDGAADPALGEKQSSIRTNTRIYTRIYTSLRQESTAEAGSQPAGDLPKQDEVQQKQEVDPATQSSTDPATVESGAIAAQETAAAQDTAAQDTAAQDTAAQDTAATSATPIQGGDSASTAQQTAATPINQQMLASFTLQFQTPIASETVVGQLLTAATKMDLPISEENIVITTADGSERAKAFSVQMQVLDLESAQRVVASMKETLSSEPFFPSASSVGGQIAQNAQTQALFALVASLIGIVGYIWFRFQHIWFGLAAVVALIHDVLVVLGAIALSYWIYQATGGLLLIDNFKISLSVVAALLTVVGYSLNDTIVVFDRIREVRGRSTKFTAEMIDVSIGQTLSRTLLTSFTTFVVVFILFGWGGESIHAFAFALTVGVVVGTYSSIFVASPVLLWLMNAKPIEIQPVDAKE